MGSACKGTRATGAAPGMVYHQYNHDVHLYAQPSLYVYPQQEAAQCYTKAWDLVRHLRSSTSPVLRARLADLGARVARAGVAAGQCKEVVDVCRVLKGVDGSTVDRLVKDAVLTQAWAGIRV